LETKHEFIYHIAMPGAWDASTSYLPDHYETDGFIHCSTIDQMMETIKVHFKEVDHLTILMMRTAKLGEKLLWEPSRAGELFPHLYRAIEPAQDVFKAVDIKQDEKGHWQDWDDLLPF